MIAVPLQQDLEPMGGTNTQLGYDRASFVLRDCPECMAARANNTENRIILITGAGAHTLPAAAAVGRQGRWRQCMCRFQLARVFHAMVLFMASIVFSHLDANRLLPSIWQPKRNARCPCSQQVQGCHWRPGCPLD